MKMELQQIPCSSTSWSKSFRRAAGMISMLAILSPTLSLMAIEPLAVLPKDRIKAVRWWWWRLAVRWSTGLTGVRREDAAASYFIIFIRKKKLPILIYVHGSGFVVASAAHPNFHDFCSYAGSSLPALVVSVEYRLAPEHRLPAAYDDVLEALNWVKEGKEKWVEEYGDLSRCVMMGDSAGGNIVYQVGLMVAERDEDFKPLIIKGLGLIQPFFSGLDRTESEIRLETDPSLPLAINDLCWDVALPVGTNRSHEYCDPLKDGGSRLLDRVRDLGMRVRVVSNDGDPLYDRSVELVKLLEKKGVNVKSMFVEGGKHGMFVGDPSKFKSKELLTFVEDLFND